MARLAFDSSDMCKENIVPFVGAVTVGTLPVVVATGCSVTGYAICIASVIESDVGPVTGSVTVRAEARVMFGRCCAGVTGVAVI
jgi:hypothetical protein